MLINCLITLRVLTSQQQCWGAQTVFPHRLSIVRCLEGVKPCWQWRISLSIFAYDTGSILVMLVPVLYWINRHWKARGGQVYLRLKNLSDMLHVEDSDHLVRGGLLVIHLTFVSDVNDLLRSDFNKHLMLDHILIFVLDELLSSEIHQIVLKIPHDCILLRRRFHFKRTKWTSIGVSV
jgi:hypothetical protein